MRTNGFRVFRRHAPSVPPSGSATGALAQLGEHLLCKQGVIGSIPIGSTSGPWAAHYFPDDEDTSFAATAVDTGLNAPF